MRKLMIASQRPWGGQLWADERLRHRVEWLAESGGGLLVTPPAQDGPCTLVGVRHIEVDSESPGRQDDAYRSVANMVRNLVSGPGDWVVHAMGVSVAMGALLARRGKARLVIEPEVSVVQHVRDRYA